MNGYGSKYATALPTKIPPSIVTEIQTLCYEIFTYINTNFPDIEKDNLDAFNLIYDRSNALVTKLQLREHATTQFYTDLRLLLSDLKNISLALIPAVAIASQVIQSNILTSSFN